MNKGMIHRMDRRTGQGGFVAIFTVLVIMTVLTLVAVGFSTVTRQAQRRTLDDQLNTQAFYAAESGVNQTGGLPAAYNPATPGALSKADCRGGTGYEYDLGDGITIDCLLINMTPTYTEDSVTTTAPVVRYISPVDGTAIEGLAFAWETPIGPGGYQGNYPELGTPGEWNAGGGTNTGLLRVDVISANALGSRSAMVDDTYSFYLYPSVNGDSLLYSPLHVRRGTYGFGEVLQVECDAVLASFPIDRTGQCNVQIEFTNPADRRQAYWVRVQSYYTDSTVRIAVVDTDGDVALPLQGAQMVVDSTGRVANVSRRIEVRMPLTSVPGEHEPHSILSAGSICKLITGIPGNSHYLDGLVSGSLYSDAERDLCDPDEP